MWFRPFWYFRLSYKTPNLFLSRVALLRRPWFYPMLLLWPWNLRPFPEQVTIVVEDIFRGSIDWGLLLVLAPVFKLMYYDLILMVIVGTIFYGVSHGLDWRRYLLTSSQNLGQTNHHILFAVSVGREVSVGPLSLVSWLEWLGYKFWWNPDGCLLNYLALFQIIHFKIILN